MPRSLIPLLVIAVAAFEGRADQRRLPAPTRPTAAVHGVPSPHGEPGFVPRSRVQLVPAGSGEAAVTVVRGMRSEPPPILAEAPAIDPALLEAPAALCGIDRQSGTLAPGQPGSVVLPARF